VREIAERIGLYRVAALLVAGALALEILRVEVFVDSTAAQVACTFGEVVLLSLAAFVFLTARRRESREP